MPAKKEKTKIILDTNWWISAFLSLKSRLQVMDLIDNDRLIIIYSSELESEYNSVISRPKFKKIKNGLDLFSKVKPLIFKVEIDKFVRLSRDPKDDYLLSLALSCNAHYLITGDKDLLVLKQIGLTQIVTMEEFLNK